MNQCNIILHDEVNITVKGLQPDHEQFLSNNFKVHPPNYRFSPKYKLGVWDGFIRYFHANGKSYYNLLDEIIPLLVSWNYQISQTDNRINAKQINVPQITSDFFSNISNDDGDPWVIRDYQLDMVNALTSNGGGVGLAATGAGKTSMVAALAKMYELADDLRSIILVPDKSLTEQTIDQYNFFKLDVGEYSGTTKNMDHQHVVSTWQALKNNPHLIKQFDVVIVDECHGLRGPVISDLLLNHGRHIRFRFGVTGTLPKDESDYLAVKLAVGTVQYEIPAHLLMKLGYLSSVHINIIQISHNFRQQLEIFKRDNPGDPFVQNLTHARFKDSYFPNYQSEKKFLKQHKPLLGKISNIIAGLNNAKKGNVLCLVDGVKYGKDLQKLIPNSIFLSGASSMEDRRTAYNRFETENHVVVIATAQIASTGLDIPRIHYVVMIDMGRAFTRVIQSIGRGLRRAKDKSKVTVYDICSDLKYGKKHMNTRIQYYNEAQYPYTIAKQNIEQ